MSGPANGSFKTALRLRHEIPDPRPAKVFLHNKDLLHIFAAMKQFINNQWWWHTNFERGSV